MTAGFRTTTARIWFVALYALATIALGFAHRPSAPAPTAAAVLAAAQALPGGLVASLCVTDDGTSDHRSAAYGCDACRIADAPGIDMPASCLPIPPAGRQAAARVADAHPPAAASLYRPVSRGPPTAA